MVQVAGHSIIPAFAADRIAEAGLQEPDFPVQHTAILSRLH